MPGPADITVEGRTTDIVGRFLLEGTNFHLVTDASPATGGRGKALGATDLLLSALLTCALNIVSGAVEPSVEKRRAVTGSAWLIRDEFTDGLGVITMRFGVEGIGQEEASELAALYRRECSIYQALEGSTRIDVVVDAV